MDDNYDEIPPCSPTEFKVKISELSNYMEPLPSTPPEFKVKATEITDCMESPPSSPPELKVTTSEITYNKELPSCSSPELGVIDSELTKDLLPNKSKHIYTKTYNNFLAWCSKKNIKGYSENIFLAYFSELSKKCKASTLWSHYSMLKCTFILNQNIDISAYSKLIAFIKRAAVCYKPTKSKTFTNEDLIKFIVEAPDSSYLMIKVVAILGIAGACRRHELGEIKVDDIQDLGDALKVTIKKTKSNAPRTFLVKDVNSEIPSFLGIFRKYLSLRPASIHHNRLFIRYNKGKCTSQPVGINHLGKTPFKIAQFLSLPNPDGYTGHCFRRSSASSGYVVDSGVNISVKKCDCKRKSNVQPSTNIDPQPSCSYNITHNSTLQKDQIPNISLGSIRNCSNMTINININIKK